jgi:hypothetical protein
MDKDLGAQRQINVAAKTLSGARRNAQNGEKLMVKDPGKITKLQGGADKDARQSEQNKKSSLTEDHKHPEHRKEETPKPAPKKEK